MSKRKFIISGGGTGGHIFPAIAIANALRRRFPGCEILFVGAKDRMEMEKVPQAGYEINGLEVAGFDRKRLWRNFSVLLKLRRALKEARSIVAKFRPDAVIGVGGYASGPTLKAAQKLGIATVVQEQNSYAGVTNKLLAKRADAVCVAYENMEKFFPPEKIVLTGNPIRKELLTGEITSQEARKGFGLDPERPTVLVIGGSLGARSLNEAVTAGLHDIVNSGVQLIWQTGKSWGERGKKAASGMKGVVVTNFISDMAKAYAAATLVVSRAGAGSISELELLAKPAILVPSPNVAEDHQTKNALALSERGAAVLVADADVPAKLVRTILETVSDKERLKKISENVGKMALRDSDEKIVDVIEANLEK